MVRSANLLGLGLLSLASGCAVQHETLARYGDYELAGDNLKSFTVVHPEPATLGRLPQCVASNVRNDSVVLTNTNTYVGPYTGNVYQSSNAVAVGGGNVIQFVSPDGTEVVARGESKNTGGMMSTWSIRYTLTVKDDGMSRTYRFAGIEQAATSNGYGYNPVHVMPGGRSGHVLGALKALAGEIDSCLR